MALTQGARGKIKSFVQDAKKLLIKEFEGQLQQYYGIRMDGSYLMVEELTTKDASIIQTARLLRERLDYLEDTIAGNDKKKEAVQQLVREQAFTILNRFAALRMAEERNIIRESIRKEYKSEGFEVFDQLTGGAKTAEQFIRYTWYIKAVFDELAIDLPAVFDRFSPYALLFPSERTFLKLLSIINQEELYIFREEGHQPVNLWQEDETIGWIYQYYNSREEISAMREASGAPRNSRELAVRNQFFTPRYVVQFLVDNSLGRQWYEMTRGKTSLSKSCQYMVKRPHEVFLEKGEQAPENKDENAHYIEYRVLKDPREILMLDPACGSMHFGLYSFDLYEQIYIEAWDNYPELMMDLRDKYLRDDFIKRIPGMIIRHNIHGVDIDPRAIQIAGLSLWLRAQKSYDNLGLQPAERPAINKSNLVVAEPMPGNAQMVSDFTKSLPGPIGKLVRVIWDKMKLAGETGLLLKIEEELKKEIEIAKQEWEEYKNTSAQTTLFDTPKESKAVEKAAIYGKEQKLTKDFFDTAEEQVLKALEKFAENAEGENAFQKLLFAEDTARGFAFIELSRKKFDIINMNPPFGLPTSNSQDYIKINYADAYVDLLATFISRVYSMCNGFIGAITSRNILITPKLERIRERILLKNLSIILDLGWPVMDDATVQSAAYIIEIGKNLETNISAFDKKKYSNKEFQLIENILGIIDEDCFICRPEDLYFTPQKRLLYNLPKSCLNIFKAKKKFGDSIADSKMGLTSFDDFRFVRAYVEVNKEKIGKSEKWRSYAKGGEYSMFYGELPLMINYEEDGKEVQAVNLMVNGQTAQARQSSIFYYRKGATYSKRSKDFAVRLLPKNYIIGAKGPGIYPISKGIFSEELLIGLLNSRFVNFLINLQANAKQFDTGIINSLPEFSFDKVTIKIIEKIVKEVIESVMTYYTIDEKSLIFSKLIRGHSIQEIQEIETILIDEIRNKIIHGLIEISIIVDKALGVDSSNFHLLINEERAILEVNSYENNLKLNVEKWIKVRTSEEISFDVISFILGLYFKRWKNVFWHDRNQIKLDNINDLFQNHSKLNNIESSSELSEFVVNEELIKFVTDYLVKFNDEKDTILNSIIEIHDVSDIKSLFTINKFFNYHMNKYRFGKREAPIYWPLSTESNTFIVWVYYPKLNSTSLYKIVNELVDPKIKEVQDEVGVLETKGSTKDLNDAKQFRDELEDFKKELLRVAQLPYKPNQDDGVLITAAPLHNLFRHNKWRKATEDCWKKLEKGEYDWAHLAISIWPERVRKKCKKDLSMAIAHGLEDICIIKPKEKKEKKKPEIKVEQQKKLM